MSSTPTTTPYLAHSAISPIAPVDAAPRLLPSDSISPLAAMLAASFLPVYSLTSPCEGIWIFDGFILITETTTLGVGDAIRVYHRHFLSSLSPPFPPPAFCGVISCISGWSRTHVAFTVQVHSSAISPCLSHRRTIYLPTAIVWLSWWQSMWGTLFPLPRCITLEH